MEEIGVPETLLVAVHGLGSARPRYPNDPLDPRNRRIAIVVR
jgi:flagellar motor protein MotB